MDASTLLQVFVASGVLTAVGEMVRWWLGRGKTRVDSAKVVQGMAIDLLKPLHEELDGAREQTEQLREQLRGLESEVEMIVSWALAAKNILDGAHLDYPAVPQSLRRRGL